jgi:hypothetical protein
MPGPLPKRTEERRRRNAVPGETLVRMPGPVKPPPAPRGVHPIARKWYVSLKASGQSQYFEPSDWAAALYVAEAMSKVLGHARFSAQAFAAVWTAMEDMMTTEAARRRARLQVQRDLEELADQDGAPPTALEEYRKALGQ